MSLLSLYYDSVTGEPVVKAIEDAEVNEGVDGGTALESYQNSAMSAPVMAYVYRDEDDTIIRVYEPVQGNDVAGLFIDKFPFDNAQFTNCVALYNSNILNVDKVTAIVSLFLATEAAIHVLKDGITITACSLEAQSLLLAGGDLFDVHLAVSSYITYSGGFHLITAIDQDAKTFTIAGEDLVSQIGLYIAVYGLVGQPPVIYFTVDSVALDGSDTVITVLETIPSDELTNNQNIKIVKAFGNLSGVDARAEGGFICQTDGITLDNCSTDANLRVRANKSYTGLSVSNFCTLAGDPTTDDVPDQSGGVFKNSGTGAISLWVNDGDSLKSIELT